MKVARRTRYDRQSNANALPGIEMVAGAGNNGSDCSTLIYPPAIYDASYTVGALNTGRDLIASFSSRGPVTVDGSNRLKPDITAPGTNNRSSYNTSDTAYAILSGTSMAAPAHCRQRGLALVRAPGASARSGCHRRDVEQRRCPYQLERMRFRNTKQRLRLGAS